MFYKIIVVFFYYFTKKFYIFVTQLLSLVYATHAARRWVSFLSFSTTLFMLVGAYCRCFTLACVCNWCVVSYVVVVVVVDIENYSHCAHQTVSLAGRPPVPSHFARTISLCRCWARLSPAFIQWVPLTSIGPRCCVKLARLTTGARALSLSYTNIPIIIAFRCFHHTIFCCIVSCLFCVFAISGVENIG